MSNRQYILALDQGTTSSRAIVFGRDGRAIAAAQQEFPQILPAPGLVEHDPEAILQSQVDTARQALAKAGLTADEVAGIGITNQRETTVLWDRHTGQPVANAIVWQSRVSAGVCERMKREGHEPTIRQKTGLVLDAYFSASKIKHLLDTMPGLRQRAEQGDILFGTVDTWLLWRLTDGACHATDASNASRTLLFNLHTLDWDDELLGLFGVPRAMLPAVCNSSGVVAHTAKRWFGRELPVAGIAGDQQAALFGQACFEPGDVKNTYGTGCFMLLNTGDRPVQSRHNLLSTVAWKLDGKATYCLEGSVFIAGAVVQWLRDGLGLADSSQEIAAMAAAVEDNGGVFFVPALVGLGAPYWDPDARGLIIGLTRGTTGGQIARAAIESMAYQSRDLLEAMQKDAGQRVAQLKVDGGAAVNDQLMQFQASVLGAVVLRPVVAETTALGAAYLAGLAVGYWNGLDDIRANWALDRQFAPTLDDAGRNQLYGRWQEAVARARGWNQPRVLGGEQ